MQYLKKILLSSTVLLACLFAFPVVFAKFNTPIAERKPAMMPILVADSLQVRVESAALYSDLSLDDIGLNAEAFNQAYKGWQKLNEQHLLNNDSILAIVDFSQPSTQKRLYIVDLKNEEVLYNTHVSHGRNSGKLMATSFSNRMSSYQSSPGFYITGTTYYGTNGYSLKLNGLDKNVNDRAMERAIVMHGADYVSERSIRLLGYLGRSQGCPAVSQKEARPIINTLKEGNCLFIYTPGANYTKRSTVLYS